MAENTIYYPVLKDDKDKEIAFEQYKLMAESITNLNSVRESSNSFWISANTLSLSWIGYLVNSDTLSDKIKPLVLSILLMVGMLLCVSWFFSLRTVKENIEIRNNIISDMEGYFAVKVFSKYFHESGRQQGKNSLTVTEMLAPFAFFLAYSAFMLMVHRL